MPKTASQQKDEWKKHIGKYQLMDDDKHIIPTTKVALEKVDDILTNPDAKKAFYEGCPPENSPEKTTARQALIDYMFDHVYEKRMEIITIDKGPIKIKALLKGEGHKLYLAALKEEQESRSFRAANLLGAHTFIEGEPKKAAVLVVAGPSASGKSTATNEFMKKLSKDILPPNTTTARVQGNHFIAIDGSIEREYSQVSQLVLQIAKDNLGYQGVKGLEKRHGLPKIKTIMNKAVKKQTDVSRVIPDTFASPWYIPKFIQELRVEIKINKLKKEAEKNGQIFVMGGVHSPSHAKEDENKFQVTVGIMGNKRAWAKKLTQVIVDSIMPNNRKIGSESKAYQGSYFKGGLFGSSYAEIAYLKNVQNPIIMQFKNDLVAMRSDPNGEWIKVTPKDIKNAKKSDDASIYFDSVLLSARDLEKWQNFDKTDLNALNDEGKKHYQNLAEFITKNDLGAWADYCRKNKVSPPIIEVHQNEKAINLGIKNAYHELDKLEEKINAFPKVIGKIILKANSLVGNRAQELSKLLTEYEEAKKGLKNISQEQLKPALENIGSLKERLIALANIETHRMGIFSTKQLLNRELSKAVKGLDKVVELTGQRDRLGSHINDLDKELKKLKAPPIEKGDTPEITALKEQAQVIANDIKNHVNFAYTAPSNQQKFNAGEIARLMRVAKEIEGRIQNLKSPTPSVPEPGVRKKLKADMPQVQRTEISDLPMAIPIVKMEGNRETGEVKKLTGLYEERIKHTKSEKDEDTPSHHKKHHHKKKS